MRHRLGNVFRGRLDTDGSFFKVSIAKLPALADEYVRWLETSPTPDTCKCEWGVHPDDALIEKDACRICACPKDDSFHDLAKESLAPEYQHEYRPRRLRLKEESSLCPVHNKVGRITGFFEWLYLVNDERK